MKYFTRSLLAYLKEICHPILKNPHTRELRVFLTSLPPAIVHQIGKDLSDYWLKTGRNIDFQYKAGHKLWTKWNQEGESQSTLQKIEEAGWVDAENRLTHYRNLEWRPDSGSDGLVVMLVGVEQATDQGSLEDFYRVDIDTIWKDRMNRRFKDWLEPFLLDHQVDPERSHLEQMEALLQTLRRNAVGDLIRISDFLEQMDFTGVMSSKDAMETLYGSLSFWGLPVLAQMGKGKWTRYIDAANDFFSYQKYLKENERNKALQKVEEFRASEAEEDHALELRDAFQNRDDLLDTLKSYIETNDPGAKDRLRQFDFAVVKDRILDYRAPDPGPDPDPDPDEEGRPKESKSSATLYGTPLEAVLTGMWQVLTDFRAACQRKKKTTAKPRRGKRSIANPAEVLRGIHLKGLAFVDFEDDNIDLARGLLGGLDAFLENCLKEIPLSPKDRENILDFSSRLLDLDEMKFQRTKAGIPHFQFEVYFEAKPKQMGIRRKFKWSLPETHPFRNLWEMAREVSELEKPPSWLPVFHIRHYREMFFAPDETEIHRVLRAGLSGMETVNLFESAAGIDPAALKQLGVTELSKTYQDFLNAFVQKGFFSALDQHWLGKTGLFQRYSDVLEKLIGKDEFRDLRPLLYKAFLIAEKPSTLDAENFPWAPFLSTAVVSGLHPCLLDMLIHRRTFLVHAWRERAEFFLKDESALKATAHTWLDICDLATVNYPIFGIVSTPSGILDTQVDSLGMLHRLGRPEQKGGPLSSKILQQYETPEDDAIRDAALFRETRESRVVSRMLKEYSTIYPHAEDGISLGVLNPSNIQAIIAGVDAFLHQKLKKDREEDAQNYPPYHFSLALFMRVAESGEISRWLKEWLKRWDPAHGAAQYAYYQNCRLSISQKVITQPEDYLALMRSGESELDIALLTRFMHSNAPTRNHENAPPFKPDLEALLKFPILEVPRCEENRHAYRTRRSRIISNRRFRLAALHSELSVRLSDLNAPPDQEHLVLSQGDFGPWVKVVDQMHRVATWVLCLDPSVDERLIQKSGEEDSPAAKREIIGFASGVGAHGELNFTVSTERSSLDDIQKVVQRKVNNLFGPWEPKDAEQTAKLLVRQARQLSGLSLVRATGKGENIRDLIAFALVRHCLPHPENVENRLCDELVVLDAFPHWFENVSGGREMYPDLLRVQAFLAKDGCIDVFADLVECKISNQVNRHLHKARSQLENGLRHLMSRFLPKGGASGGGTPGAAGGVPILGKFADVWESAGKELSEILSRFPFKPRGKAGFGQPLAENAPIFRYDQRFWWAQLQRLIANKTVVEPAMRESATSGLESMGEGNFRIYWNAAALTIWSESFPGVPEDTFKIVNAWPFELYDCKIIMPLIACGRGLLRHLGRTSEAIELPLASSTAGEIPEQSETPPAAPVFEEQASAEIEGQAPGQKEPDLKRRPLDVVRNILGKDREQHAAERREPAPNPEPATPEREDENDGPENLEPVPAPSPSEAAAEAQDDGETAEKQEPAPQPAPSPKEFSPGVQDEGGSSEKFAWDSPVEFPDSRIPERIFLGKTESNREIFWEFGHPALTNRHILIFGQSGVGKTYAIQALLMEMAKQGQNSVIIDYTNGFLPTHLESEFQECVAPATHLVRQQPLPINPFRALENRIEGFDPLPEGPHEVGARITTVINSVYSNVGEQQRAMLSETIAEGLEEEGDQFHFSSLLEKLKNQANPGPSLASKLAPFVRMNLFRPDGTENWERLYGNPESLASIFQLAGVARQIAQIATEFILWDLYDYASNAGGKDRPLPMVLDEIQNLDHQLDAPLGKFLTEGRKFGLSLILATQTLSNLKGEERDRLFQASHKLFFKPAETEVKEYARILEQGSAEKADVWISRLNKLNKGECYSLGPALNPGTDFLEYRIFKIKISALPERLGKEGRNG